jgi:hypothetical protein
MLDLVPQELRNLPHWILWASESRNGDKPTKVPYCLDGTKASSTDPSRWSTFQGACGALSERYSGIGFVFTKALGIVGVDLDNCLDDSGGVMSWAQSIYDSLSSSYHEVSPSGNGVKFWCRASLPGPGIKCDHPLGKEHGAIELYDQGRYFAVTGKAMGGSEITELQEPVLELYDKILKFRDRGAAPQQRKEGPVTAGGRHAHLLTVGGAMRNSGMGPDAILNALRSENAATCVPPKPEFELEGIVNYLSQKPAKYRLMPADIEAFIRLLEPAQMTADGATAATPLEKHFDSDLISIRLKGIIESKDVSRAYNDEDFIGAVAAAGDIRTHEIRRLLGNAFPKTFAAKEFKLRVREAKQKQDDDRQPVQEGDPYLRTDTGAIRPILANAITALKKSSQWNEVLAFDEFELTVHAVKDPPFSSPQGKWNDQHDRLTTEWLQHKDIFVTVETAGQAVQTLARMRSVHPVRQYLESLSWDGYSRNGTLAVDYFGAKDTIYNRGIARLWLISAIARVMNPGCKVDCCLVLEGKQGAGKSTAISVLAGKWFTDELAEFGSKDASLQMQGAWIIELGELDQMKGREMSSVKAFISRQNDRFRPPYGKHPIDVGRQCVFAGSTNQSQWHHDETGARRFWPIACGKMDIPGLAKDRDQIWAEAYADWESGASWWIKDADLNEAAMEEQGNRYTHDVWHESIERWLSDGMPKMAGISFHSRENLISLSDVFAHCLNKPIGSWTSIEQNRVIRSLRTLGYECNRAMVGGVRSWYYSKGEVGVGGQQEMDYGSSDE